MSANTTGQGSCLDALLPCVLIAALCRCSAPIAKADPAPDVPKVRVQAALVEERAVKRSVRLTGTLVADRESTLAADVAGKVVATLFQLGDTVQQGQALIRLDSRAAQLSNQAVGAELARLHAEDEGASRDCERAAQLFQSGAISRAEHEQSGTRCLAATHSVQAAEARLGLSNKALSDAVLRAPFSGVISERSVSAGEYVNVGRKIATLVDARILRLRVAVPESFSLEVAKGSRLEFSIEGRKERVFFATVERLSPTVDAISRDLVVEALVEQHDAALKPGMFATCNLVIGERKLPVVPSRALTGSTASRRVFVIRERRLEERVVRAEEDRDGQAQILHGLAAGEMIVLEPGPELHDGLRVQEPLLAATRTDEARAIHALP